MRLIAGGVAVLAPTIVAGALMVSVDAAQAASAPACSSLGADVERTPVTASSAPLRAIDAVAAQQRLRAEGTTAGAGVTVAVLSSGVRPGVVPTASLKAPNFARQSQIDDPQGTIVAGLIAGASRSRGGPVGVAPAARVLDVRVFDVQQPGDLSQAGPEPGRLTDALEWVRSRASSIDIAVVPVQTEASTELERAVDRLSQAGVIVVAAAGDKLDDEQGIAYPGGYPAAVTVGAAGGTSEELIPNPETDLAAPTLGAVSLGLNGGNCLVDTVSTAYAAGEVAGALALLKSAYGGSNAELLARLVDTASGRPDVRSPYVGAGVIDLDQALVRDREPDADGLIGQTSFRESTEPIRAPEPEPDLFASTRDHAVWWGLLGGGLLLLALIGRPLVRRRGR